MTYTECLTPEERLDAIRAGAVDELAVNNVPVDRFERAVKQAQMSIPSLTLEGIGRTALVAGVPLGLLYYVVNKSLKKSDSKTKKLQKELDYYNDVMSELKNNYTVSRGTMG